jgi:ABC-type lipoprotein release transport system permease subunit
MTMALVPFRYNWRCLIARPSATTMTVLSIAATVGVLAGVLCLQQGFSTMVLERGREDLAIFLRPGANSEGESGVTRERAAIVVKETPEIARTPEGAPLAAAEMFLAVSLEKVGGGKTNVPIRGVQPATYQIHGDDVRVIEGQKPKPGSDELIVGKALVDRIQNCRPGEVLMLNVTPFRIVGVFEARGSYRSELWGDVDRLQEALRNPEFNRVIAVLQPGTTAKELNDRLKSDVRTPAKVVSEREYLAAQTGMLSGMLQVVGGFLAVIMGIGAVFTGTNAMLASISSRAHEIGILLATGFRPWAVFVAFLGEALVLGLLGGLVGCLLVMLLLDGVETGTTNFATFTEIAFAFRFTPTVLLSSVVFALVLGLVGGAIPAFRAARMVPTNALRRG